MSVSYISEEVLKFIIHSADTSMLIMPDRIYSAFSYSQRTIRNALNELQKNNLIHFSVEYDGSDIHYVKLLSAGKFYFENKSAQTAQPSSITINNSSGVTIGSNNSVSIETGIDFSEAYNAIEKIHSSDKEVLKELISTIQDCLENSKPLPKGKFAKAVEITADIVPIINTIGNILFKFFTQ
jgi:hypothetical protein